MHVLRYNVLNLKQFRQRFSSAVVLLELGPINRLRYRQSITINNNRIIENNNTAYLRYAVLKFF